MTSPATRRRARREGRQGNALFVSSVILLVVALGATAAALVVRHDTADLRARTEPVHRQMRDLAATEASARERLRLLRARAHSTAPTLAALFAAEQSQVDASNHAVDVANQAVDQYNNAQTADLAGAFKGAGDAATADLDAKTGAVRAAAEAAQRDVAGLLAVAGG